MYGPDVAILLMYGSHVMRHTGFLRLTVVNETPRDLGRHNRRIILEFFTLQFINLRVKFFFGS